jgi:hypothetical protein
VVAAAPVFAAGVREVLAAVAGFAAAGGVEGEFAAGVCCAGVLAARKSPAAAREIVINVVLDIYKYCGIPRARGQIESGARCDSRVTGAFATMASQPRRRQR